MDGEVEATTSLVWLSDGIAGTSRVKRGVSKYFKYYDHKHEIFPMKFYFTIGFMINNRAEYNDIL